MQVSSTATKNKQTMSVFLDIDNLSNGPTNGTTSNIRRPKMYASSSSPPPQPLSSSPPLSSKLEDINNRLVRRNSLHIETQPIPDDYDSDDPALLNNYRHNGSAIRMVQRSVPIYSKEPLPPQPQIPPRPTQISLIPPQLVPYEEPYPTSSTPPVNSLHIETQPISDDYNSDDPTFLNDYRHNGSAIQMVQRSVPIYSKELLPPQPQILPRPTQISLIPPQLVPYEEPYPTSSTPPVNSLHIEKTLPVPNQSSILSAPIFVEPQSPLVPPLEDEYIPRSIPNPNLIDPKKVPLNVDHDPLVITKKQTQPIEQIRNITVKYLKPPKSPPPGDIVIHQEPDVQSPPVPPLVIVLQRPSSPSSPIQGPLEPVVIRENPPVIQLDPIGEKHVSVPGRILPPPPRQVIVERFAPAPSPPPDVIHEKWLPPDDELSHRRKVVYIPSPPVKLAPKPKNVLIEWQTPEVRIREHVENLGVHEVSREEYAQLLAEANVTKPLLVKPRPVPILYGDVEYLKLVDLKCHGLGEYEEQIKHRLGRVGAQPTPQTMEITCHNFNVADKALWKKCECQNCRLTLYDDSTNMNIVSVSAPIPHASNINSSELMNQEQQESQIEMRHIG